MYNTYILHRGYILYTQNNKPRERREGKKYENVQSVLFGLQYILRAYTVDYKIYNIWIQPSISHPNIFTQYKTSKKKKLNIIPLAKIYIFFIEKT